MSTKCLKWKILIVLKSVHADSITICFIMKQFPLGDGKNPFIFPQNVAAGHVECGVCGLA